MPINTASRSHAGPGSKKKKIQTQKSEPTKSTLQSQKQRKMALQQKRDQKQARHKQSCEIIDLWAEGILCSVI